MWLRAKKAAHAASEYCSPVAAPEIEACGETRDAGNGAVTANVGVHFGLAGAAFSWAAGPLSVPGLPSIPGTPAASDDDCHSFPVTLERPTDSFWTAVWGTTFLPDSDAGPDVLPAAWAKAAPPHKAKQSGDTFTSERIAIGQSS
jgi:hypothetical protein